MKSLATALCWILLPFAGPLAAADKAPPLNIQGFGTGTVGGEGGKTLWVTRLDDDPIHPAPGTLRWALRQEGPREVKFKVEGDIVLKDFIDIRSPFLTIDGSDAPGHGVCVRSGSLLFHGTHDIIVRYVRIRLGEEAAARQRRAQGGTRPQFTAGLECVGLFNSRHIVFDHCSLSWSCKEIFDINHCREVSVQWCMLTEPLAGPTLHPYGDDHACMVNASAGTLSIHHCLMEHYVFRGPQFECNDMAPKDQYAVQMEASNNVMADFEQSGSRFSVGVEKGNGTGGKTFRFQFLNNLYLSPKLTSRVFEAITNHGVTDDVRIHISGNILRYPAKRLAFLASLAAKSIRPTVDKPVQPPFWRAEDGPLTLETKLSPDLLFSTSATKNIEPVDLAAQKVMAEAGCSLHRDDYDLQMIADVEKWRFGKVDRK